MKIKELIKELELYDKELRVVVQSQPFIMVDIGSFDKKTVVHIFSLDEQKLKAHIQKDKTKWCDCGDELRSEEDVLAKTCWICRSVGRTHENEYRPK